jgi:two-component system OmpR family sensor kinase
VPSGPAERTTIRVLLIEDDEAHAWFISRYLKQVENVRIALSHAATLADGLRLLASQPFDAVLLDLRLPDSDIDETVSRIIPHALNVPIIVLSTLEDPSLAKSALEQGAEDYLWKGNLSSELLYRAIQHAIERQLRRIREDASRK